MYCFISGCPNSNDSSKDSKKARMVQIFFSAPEDESLFKQWQISVPKNNRAFLRGDKLCDFHFKKSEVVLFNETKLPNGNVRRVPALEPKLKAGTIPSIFPEVKEASKKIINAEVQKTTLKRKLSSCDESDIPNSSQRSRGRPKKIPSVEQEKSTPTPPAPQRSKKIVSDSDTVVPLEERLFKEIGSDDESNEELAAGMQPSIRLVPLEVLLATSQSKKKGTKSTAAPKSVLESRKRKAALLAQTADNDKIIKKSKSEEPMKKGQQKTLSKPMESRTKERANIDEICSELELMAGEISDELDDEYEIERITDPGSTQDDNHIFEILSIKSDPDGIDQKKTLEELAAELADSGAPVTLDSTSTEVEGHDSEDTLDTSDSKPIREPLITEVISLQGLDDDGNPISDKGKKVDNIEMEMAKMLGESGQSEATSDFSNQEKAVHKFRSLETDKNSLMKDLTTGELPESKSNSELEVALPEEGISKDSVKESPSKKTESPYIETENINKSNETLLNEDTSEINSLRNIGEDPQLLKEGESEHCASKETITEPQLSKVSESDQSTLKDSSSETQLPKENVSEQYIKKDNSVFEPQLSKEGESDQTTSKDSLSEIQPSKESESEQNVSENSTLGPKLSKENEFDQNVSKESAPELNTSKENKTEVLLPNESASEQSSSKDSKTEAPLLKESESEQSSSKDSKTEAPLLKESESEQSTSKGSKTEVPLPKENESEQSSLKECETVVTISNESESEQSTPKDSETEVPLSKESEPEPSTSKDSETEIPLSKESGSEQSTSKDSEVPLSNKSVSEQIIPKDSGTEVPLSKESESEQISSTNSVTESQIAKDSGSEDATKENESEMSIVIESITGSHISKEAEFEPSENDNAKEPILIEDATDSNDTFETLSKNIDPKLSEKKTKAQKSSGSSKIKRTTKKKKFDGLVSSDDEIIDSPELVLNISSDSEADPTWAPNADAIEVSDANDTDPDSDKDESDTEIRGSNSNKGSKGNINNKSKVGSKPSSTIVAPAEVSKLLTQDALQQILRKLKLPLDQPVSFHIADDATVGMARSIASPKRKEKSILPRGKVIEPKKQNENTPTYKPRPSRRAQISAEKSKKCTKLLGLRMFEGLGKIKKAFDFSTFLTDIDEELQFKKFCLILKECLKDVCESKNAVTNIGKLTLKLSNKTIKNILPIPDLEPIQQPKQIDQPSTNDREVHQENVDEAEMLECMTVDSNVENHLNPEEEAAV